MDNKFSSDQKTILVQNALTRLDHPAFFARLNALGIKVCENEASEYRILGEEMLALVEQLKSASSSGNSASIAALHKHAAEQGLAVPGSDPDSERDREIRQFVAAQLKGDNSIIPTLAQLVNFDDLQ